MTIRLDAVLQAVELPAGIADLATSLANVDGDALTLEKKNEWLIYALYHVHEKKKHNKSKKSGMLPPNV